MTPQQYIDNIHARYKQGNATEHTFRGDLQQLIESIVPDVTVTNEPKRQSCGAPDYIISRKNIPVGYIEAKDVGDNDLEGKKKSGNKEQFDRYKNSLDNLIFTDYLDFHLYQNGEFVTKIAIGEITDKGIVAIRENFEAFENLIKDFTTHVSQTIKSSKELAKMMAGKARLLSDVIERSLNSDEDSAENSTLTQQMQAFKDILLHDITPKEFADIYAQTITYGMFAARLNDPTLENFSRQEAAELIPKSNPFLRKLFGYIAGPDIDDRIKWIVDGLADVFLHTDVQQLLSTYGKATQMEDPIIHFYEDFLAEYDPKLRKARGVWYTPAPVVNFIVRGVDEILKKEFGLKQGLADTTQTTIKVNTDNPDQRSPTGYRQIDKQVDKVQILDPAAGTGTFLAEVIKQIYARFQGQQGIWSGYVEKHLIPRLYGFEILMASYAMAHLKLDLLLKETGYESTKNERLQIYLTNSLEEAHPDTGTLFASWLSEEANQANRVKRDAPIMVVMGNPPYSGESSNKGKWIMDLMEDYKKEPGGKEKLQERNPKWINDDYVKFIRYGQYFIEKNGEGILAFINPHGFLDNPTFRGMRWNLLNTFDAIYTLDLHGNSKKKETAPDGSKDENVFDIMQGVSINFFIKTGQKKEGTLGKIYHADLYGKRKDKYDYLIDHDKGDVQYEELPNVAPNYFFVPKDFETQEEYDKGIKVNEFFPINGVGLTTAHDEFVINENKKELLNFYKEFQTSDRDSDLLHKKFNVRKKTGWNILDGYDNIRDEDNLESYIEPISYRPFDNRYIFYEDKLVWRTVRKVMQHFLNGENVGLAIPKINKENDEIGYSNVFITENIMEARLADRFITSVFPLYLYPISKERKLDIENQGRQPNFHPEMIQQFAKGLGLEFVPDHEDLAQEDRAKYFTPLDVLDYIYAVLHSPAYREKYKEFLKIDFPRVPYPTDQKKFWALVEKGRELRELHLLESPEVQSYITTYPKDGDNTITRKITKNSPGYEPTNDTVGKVWINDAQYFDGIPLVAWEFYIGGYQPAQKWLKDRVGRTLSFEDIQHYQEMIVALTRTAEIMEEIDEVGVVEIE